MKSAGALPNTLMLITVFLNCKKHISTCIYIKKCETNCCSLLYTKKKKTAVPQKKIKPITSQQERRLMINTTRKTETIMCLTSTRKVNRKCSSLLAIGSRCSTGNHVIRNFHVTCCHQQEILTFPSSGWYWGSWVDVTCYLPSAPIPDSGG
jgi:hypothetical protein